MIGDDDEYDEIVCGDRRPPPGSGLRTPERLNAFDRDEPPIIRLPTPDAVTECEENRT